MSALFALGIGLNGKKVYILELSFVMSLIMKLKKLGVGIGRYMQENPIETFLILFISLLVVIMASLYARVDYDDANWEKFKTEHNCQIRFTNTGTQRASWICDDGKTYFRWRQQR